MLNSKPSIEKSIIQHVIRVGFTSWLHSRARREYKLVAPLSLEATIIHDLNFKSLTAVLLKA